MKIELIFETKIMCINWVLSTVKIWVFFANFESKMAVISPLINALYCILSIAALCVAKYFINIYNHDIRYFVDTKSCSLYV